MRVVSDRARPWYPAIAPFQIDPCDPTALRWFARACKVKYRIPARQALMIYQMARGLTATCEIAHSLGLAASTVKNELHPLYARLGVADRSAAVVAVWPLYTRARRMAAMVRAAERTVEGSGAETTLKPEVRETEYRDAREALPATTTH